MAGCGRRVAEELWTRPAQNLAPLDGLRGFAISIVVFYHCVLFTGFFARDARGEESSWLPVVANGFWSGVDIMFVLSGFLIGRLLIRDLERDGRLYFKSFYLRRGFRIFPAYYLVLTVSLFAIAPLGIPIFQFLYLWVSDVPRSRGPTPRRSVRHHDASMISGGKVVHQFTTAVAIPASDAMFHSA